MPWNKIIVWRNESFFGSSLNYLNISYKKIYQIILKSFIALFIINKYKTWSHLHSESDNNSDGIYI